MKRYAPFAIAALLAALLLPSPANAQTITIDTTAITGQSGFLEFQFNPDTSATMPLDASVSITQYSGGLMLGPVDTANTVNATGALPNDITITNAGSVNTFRQAITFGDAVAFTPNFTATNPNTADGGNTFLLFFLAPDGSLLSTTDPSGQNTALLLTQNADGTLSAPQISAPLAAPEPAPWLPLALGVLGVAWLRSRRPLPRVA